MKVFTPTTVTNPRTIAAFASTQTWGVHVGTGDVDGDGVEEILAALGSGGSADVLLFNNVSTAAIDQWFAEATTYTKGLFVAGS